MHVFIAVTLVVGFVALVGLGIYSIFFSKPNTTELTNLEKRYVDPPLAEKQKAELDAANAAAEAKAKVEGIVVKVEGKV